jgi:hypothetical protein
MCTVPYLGQDINDHNYLQQPLSISVGSQLIVEVAMKLISGRHYSRQVLYKYNGSTKWLSVTCGLNSALPALPAFPTFPTALARISAKTHPNYLLV